MVRAEPPTPRRPAAPGPVRHTQRPGAGRPPPTPPPAGSAASAAAARGICPLAGPGRADAKLSDEGTLGLTGPCVGEVGGGRVGMERGREERGGPPRPGPTPSSGRTGVTTPRRVGRAGEGCRAHAPWRPRPSSPAPAVARLPEAPPQSSRAAAALRQHACAFVPLGPLCTSHLQSGPHCWGRVGGTTAGTQRKVGGAGRDAAAG